MTCMQRLQNIIADFTDEAIIEGTIEEMAELTACLAKRMRILRGENPTPTTALRNFDDIREEFNDCVIMLKALDLRFELTDERAIERKLDRWESRLRDLRK